MTRKFNIFEEIQQNQEVQFSGSNEWWGKFGIVENINKDSKRAEIFAMEHPDLRYIVREDNIGDIELVER